MIFGFSDQKIPQKISETYEFPKKINLTPPPITIINKPWAYFQTFIVLLIGGGVRINFFISGFFWGIFWVLITKIIVVFAQS